MPIEQSGANATAEIHGNFNDVHGDQINLFVHGNVTLPEQTGRRKESVTTLESTIQIIQDIASLVSIDVANTILMDIVTILSLLQKHTKRKESLNPLARSCKAICSTSAFVAKGVSTGRASRAHWNALDALQLSIDGLKSRVKDAMRHRRVCGFFRVREDHRVKEIIEWTAELDRISTSFSAKLNIVCVICLEQIYELLQRSDVPNLIPEPPPLPPTMFFGRQDLLRTVRDVLLRDENVALIGPGGIGKSTLAMAVMNEDVIVQRYRRRFFVCYEGMNPRTITFASFVDRIASVLGLPMSGAGGEHQIKCSLALSPVLLALDNAETFEDAVDRDEAGRISSLIAHITNTCGTVIILTSRTSSNARRISWTQIDVPPLEKEPARLSFRSIYHGEISDSLIDALLATVDFHPLSISILAHTARESRWSGKVLWDRWNSQQGEILQTGDGKENFGFTIQLSLESPSVKALGDNGMRVLHIIAFFPQGINQDHLTSLFPSVHRISSVIDAFCKVSLIYPSGPFLTMLAPIRIFFLDAFPADHLDVLGDVRQMYYALLKAISEDKDFHADLLVSDHLNIEHLIAFDIAHALFDIEDISWHSYWFLLGLKWHKPRPTSLASIIFSLPEETAVEKCAKARCLDALGDLYHEFSDYLFSSTASSAAQILFVAIGDNTMAAGCASTVALSWHTLGKFSQAQQLLDDFICSSSWKHVDEEAKAEIYYMFDLSRMCSSSEGADALFLRSRDYSWRGLQSRVRHWEARMYHGYNTPEEVERQLEPLQFDCMSSANAWDRSTFLETLAEAAFLQHKFDAAMQYLTQAHESVNNDFRLTVKILMYKAAVASVQRNYDLARSLLQRCLDTLSVVATSSSNDFPLLFFVRGRNELYAGDCSTARQFLTDAVAYCDISGEVDVKALCMRALGEAGTLLGQKTESDRYFAQAMVLCKEAGMHPKLLCVCQPMINLDDDKFPGWKRFLGVHAQ